MKKLKIILLLPLLLVAVQLKAQVNIGVDTVYSFKTLVNNFEVVNYTVWIKNFGPDTLFNGNLNVYTAVDTGNGLNIIKIDPTLSGMAIFPPNTTIVLPDFATYIGGGNNNYSLSQGNVIVIWPQAVGANLIESFTDTVYIANNTEIDELRIEKNRIEAWPNPTKEQVFLSILDPQITIERVRIYDSKGKDVLNEEHPIIIDVKKLPSGTYILSATLSNGQVRTLKLIKE